MKLGNFCYMVLMVTIWWSLWSLLDIVKNHLNNKGIISPCNLYILSFTISVILIHKYKLDKLYA